MLQRVYAMKGPRQKQSILIEYISLHRRKAHRRRREVIRYPALIGVGKGLEDCTALRGYLLWCDMILC
jgi:hypothetical protein